MNTMATAASPGPVREAATRIQEFLAFKIGEEEYGVDILRVQEIRSFEAPTRMANTPPHILGVINLRGVIVPIVDMRIKFGIDKLDYDSFTVVIVLDIGTQIVGMVVDGVSDVIAFKPEQLRPAPEFTAAIGSDHVMAIGAMADRMLVLLEIEKLMSGAEMGLMAQMAH